MERAFCRDVARIAPAHAVASCRWNRDAGAGDALARVAEWTDYDLVAAEDVDKTFARERTGRQDDAPEGEGRRDRRREAQTRRTLGGDQGAHGGRARAPRRRRGGARANGRGGGGDALAPLEYFFDAPTALRESEADAAAESAIERIANAPAALVDTVESLLWTMRVFTFG